MKNEKEILDEFTAWLISHGRSIGTAKNYKRSMVSYLAWLGCQEVGAESANTWKAELLKSYAPVTVNTMLAALNSYASFSNLGFQVNYVRIQRRLFREEGRELKRDEFECLLKTAQETGKERLALLMETICSSGIRVSEVKYITVEAAKAGKAEISLKGKIRTILLPGKLCKKLLRYANKNKISSGEIFITGSGKSMSRGQIWAEMKALCKQAGVAESKVYPHNLRHLFAIAFYKISRDIARLADVLGHSSIETTRIYLLTSGTEHRRQLERMGLVT